jgi:hypothetical protein
MSNEVFMTEARVEPATPALTSRLSSLRILENAVVSAALFAMILIPLAESFLRRTFHSGIPASTSIVQHLVLIVGMLGGAIAAREGRLLSLSNFGDTHLRGRLKTVARIFGNSVSCKRSGVQEKFWPTGSQCGLSSTFFQSGSPR